ncbi:MAG: enoyl-CoA hydratase/isomerase [Gammaproteobacteria bacterium]|nr:MAG: enoyl-CoA hydratase/isomerase [Gammaproteobacteria bacterium]
MKYTTIQVRFDGTICFLKLYRPESGNTINDVLIDECTDVLKSCEKEMTIVVLEGLPEVFCFGADFKQIQEAQRPENLYDLFRLLSHGSFISVAHVKGKVNAGGVGFVAACDIVLADEKATFGLSELLFGLFPACVLPFLIRKIGYQHAHYMTLMNKAISVQQAAKYGLVDMYEADSENLLKKHLLHLRRLSKKTISEYKNYTRSLMGHHLDESRTLAIKANRAMFEDKDNLHKISDFIINGNLPWQGGVSQ